MKRKHTSGVWDTLLIVAVAALAVTFAHGTQARADEPQKDGRIVDLTPQTDKDKHDIATSDGEKSDDLSKDQAAETQPQYWLGIEGGPLDSDVLRTHLQLADDVGVVVRAVVPKSPAEKAGIRQHDIIISVGGEQVAGMPTLQKAVAASNAKPIELKVIRLAKEQTIAVTPEPMPQEMARVAANPGEDMQFNFGANPMGDINEVLKQLQVGGGAGGIRVFGPGMIVGGQGGQAGKLPGGVSVSVTREGDKPAKITVKQGDKTWNIDGNDPKALNELPDEIKPFVAPMLGAQQGPNVFFRQFQGGANPMRIQLPAVPPQIGQNLESARKRSEEASQRMLKQMEQMQKQMQEMQEQINKKFPIEGTNPAADPSKT